MKYINTNKQEKLDINKDNTYIIIDFDKTMTSKESKDSWDIAATLLEEEMKKKYKLTAKDKVEKFSDNLSMISKFLEAFR